ncbi:hypothetical protein P171DRAFT_421346 [Karstenula rhodostoma CBS 690.94]|uniref:Uncharacterized protein n=1 Tax=Karstenula rhodostoma CBS 690.94 TaxID=1392251 RepID=A0A9P4PB71_9PLEO|nr:hypothetical protein P171DRAFT_421346 [Karstenula rhodostoma CBS 690.94]
MSAKHEQGAINVKQKNGVRRPSPFSIPNLTSPPVLHKPLARFFATASSATNLPSTVHAGFCNPGSPIAAILTASFLDFSSKQGLDLRGAGVKEGSRYCIDTAPWRKAVDGGIKDVQVKLEASHESALEGTGIEELKKWAAGGDNERGVVWPGDGKSGGGLAKTSGEVGGKKPKA